MTSLPVNPKCDLPATLYLAVPSGWIALGWDGAAWVGSGVYVRPNSVVDHGRADIGFCANLAWSTRLE